MLEGLPPGPSQNTRGWHPYKHGSDSFTPTRWLAERRELRVITIAIKGREGGDFQSTDSQVSSPMKLLTASQLTKQHIM